MNISLKSENEISNTPNLYLDTSIQIEKETASSNEKGELSQLLQACSRLCTSTYVKMEYRRSLIGDLVYLYNQLVDAENLAAVLFRIEALPTQNQRKLKRVLSSIAGFLSEPGIGEVKTKDVVEFALPYFRSIIDNWPTLFDKSVNYNVLDGTGCYIARGTAILQGTRYDTGVSNCKPREIRCSIVEFFKNNIDNFKKILDKMSAIQSLDDEQKKLIAVLEKAVEYPQNLADAKNCRRCGDAIIAVECPAEYIIFTKNEKHFRPICEIIDKEMLVYK